MASLEIMDLWHGHATAHHGLAGVRRVGRARVRRVPQPAQGRPHHVRVQLPSHRVHGAIDMVGDRVVGHLTGEPSTRAAALTPAGRQQAYTGALSPTPDPRHQRAKGTADLMNVFRDRGAARRHSPAPGSPASPRGCSTSRPQRLARLGTALGGRGRLAGRAGGAPDPAAAPDRRAARGQRLRHRDRRGTHPGRRRLGDRGRPRRPRQGARADRVRRLRHPALPGHPRAPRPLHASRRRTP